MNKLTADTITDEQIRELIADTQTWADQGEGGLAWQRIRICQTALGEHSHVVIDAPEARARCADFCNLRVRRAGVQVNP